MKRREKWREGAQRVESIKNEEAEQSEQECISIESAEMERKEFGRTIGKSRECKGFEDPKKVKIDGNDRDGWMRHSRSGKLYRIF